MQQTDNQLVKLGQLLRFSDRYEINIQFWPEQTAVYISKDEVELESYGGDFDFAIKKSLEYLNRINKNYDKEYFISLKNKVIEIKFINSLDLLCTRKGKLEIY